MNHRHLAVLNALAHDGARPATFQAIRRRLAMHPQALARALRSLVASGKVTKDGRQYALAAAARLPALPVRETVPVFSAVLPPAVGRDAAVQQMERRWFRQLHFYGRRDVDGITELTWTTEAGHHVHLRISERAVRLDADAQAAGDASLPAAVRSLLAAVADLYAAPEISALVRA
jgi:DNA-binding Lrp family transcriptional regulator